MEISVILPVFNAAATVAAAMESIRAQTFVDWELVVVDDGSTDKSAEIAKSLSEKDPRIRVIGAEHGGIVRALQLGCARSRGRYLARMDADDIAHPLRFERQLAVMDSDGRIGLCGTEVRMIGESMGAGRLRYEAWINGLMTHEAIVRELFVECPLAHPTFLMTRAAYDAAGGYEDNGWAEDYDLVFRLFLNDFRFAKATGALLEWRESPGRLSMRSDRYSPIQFRNLKRHYLLRTYLANGRTFFQWGAGEVGKKWLREWGGRRPEGVVDINTRKVGTFIHDTKVIAPEELPPPGAGFIVVAVGTLGARDEIRAWLNAHAYRECRDYLFLA